MHEREREGDVQRREDVMSGSKVTNWQNDGIEDRSAKAQNRRDNGECQRCNGFGQNGGKPEGL